MCVLWCVALWMGRRNSLGNWTKQHFMPSEHSENIEIERKMCDCIRIFIRFAFWEELEGDKPSIKQKERKNERKRARQKTNVNMWLNIHTSSSLTLMRKTKAIACGAQRKRRFTMNRYFVERKWIFIQRTGFLSIHYFLFERKTLCFLARSVQTTTAQKQHRTMCFSCRV